MEPRETVARKTEMILIITGARHSRQNGGLFLLFLSPDGIFFRLFCRFGRTFDFGTRIARRGSVNKLISFHRRLFHKRLFG